MVKKPDISPEVYERLTRIVIKIERAAQRLGISEEDIFNLTFKEGGTV